MIQGADTVGDALLDASRFIFVHSPSYQLVLETARPEDADRTLRFDVDVDPDVPYRQLIDGCLASLTTLARALLGRPLRPSAVSLPHTPAAPRRTYEGVFGATVFFDQPRAALHLPASLLDEPLHGARRELRRTAMAEIARRYPSRDATTATLVRNALRGTLGITPGTKAEIAELLDLHTRTLQRRLEAEATTFDALRDDVRRTATHQLLTESTLPLGEAAHALGFSEHSALSRKVRQWYGVTPTELRRDATA